MKTYKVDVVFLWKVKSTYYIKAYSRPEAKKKAKDLFLKDWFRYQYLDIRASEQK